MNRDRATTAPLLLCSSVLVLAAAYYARPIIAPMAVALFIVAVVWPLQSALQKGIPTLLALVVGVPILIAVLTVCEEHESTKWLAILLSGRDGKPA